MQLALEGPNEDYCNIIEGLLSRGRIPLSFAIYMRILSGTLQGQ